MSTIARRPASAKTRSIVLQNLTAGDLKELGVGALGHRRKLLDPISMSFCTQHAPR